MPDRHCRHTLFARRGTRHPLAAEPLADALPYRAENSQFIDSLRGMPTGHPLFSDFGRAFLFCNSLFIYFPSGLCYAEGVM